MVVNNIDKYLKELKEKYPNAIIMTQLQSPRSCLNEAQIHGRCNREQSNIIIIDYMSLINQKL